MKVFCAGKIVLKSFPKISSRKKEKKSVFEIKTTKSVIQLGNVSQKFI